LYSYLIVLYVHRMGRQKTKISKIKGNVRIDISKIYLVMLSMISLGIMIIGSQVERGDK